MRKAKLLRREAWPELGEGRIIRREACLEHEMQNSTKSETFAKFMG
jgi:hypothetical protein